MAKKKKPITKKKTAKKKIEPSIIDYNKEELEKELKREHKLFCERLIVNSGNETQSYIDVYPNASYETSMANGSRLLRNAKIRAYYAILCQEVSGRNLISAKWLYDKHKAIISSNVMEFMSINESNLFFKSLDDIPEEIRWMIQKIKQTKDGIHIELIDKQKSFDALGKIGGHYIDKSENVSQQEVIIRSEKENDYMNGED